MKLAVTMNSGIRITLFLTIIGLASCQSATIEHHHEKQDEWMLQGFEKADSENPILAPSPGLSFYCPVRKEEVNWEVRNVLNPSAVVRNGKVNLIYRAQDENNTSRLGLATSDDGIHFEKHPVPIFYPDNDDMKSYEWPGGVEDPRIIEDSEGRYFLTYTAYDGAVARLCIASSTDLLNWVKHGLVLNSKKYIDTWSKSGAIVTEKVGQKFVARKIQNKYWMYFGDTDLFIATSDDLLNWEVAEDNGMERRISVLQPRPGYFDSRLVEPGPAPFITNEGILLIYNARNASNYHDTDLIALDYAAGQALFDKEKPYKLLKRSDHHFLHPEKEYEKIGEVDNVVFAEGLVDFHDKWFLYYGTADSKIAVAIKQ